MHIKLKVKLLIMLLILLVATPIISLGCQEESEQLPALQSPSELASTLVPNTPLDLYVYAKQESPTVIPAEMIDLPHDIEVESFAIWGARAENKFALGMGLTLISAGDASEAYAEIDPKEDGWKKLSDNTIYLVYGSGTPAEALKTAMLNNDFKHYDDSESLKAAALLPSGGTTKLAAIALAKPSKALIGFLTRDADHKGLEIIDLLLKMVNLKIIAGGLYSPRQLDLDELTRVMESDSSISKLDLGILILIKSGLPSFIVEPAFKKLLTEEGFTETNLGGGILYKGYWDIDDAEAIPVLVRIEGNHIFAALSEQESYAETIISSVRVR